jgi:hypothetical protein
MYDDYEITIPRTNEGFLIFGDARELAPHAQHHREVGNADIAFIRLDIKHAQCENSFHIALPRSEVDRVDLDAWAVDSKAVIIETYLASKS